MMNFLNYYDIGKPVQIEIDQINNLKDDKLLVIMYGNNEKKQGINEKYIGLNSVAAEKIDKAIQRDKSFVLSEVTSLQSTTSTLVAAKKNFFTTILVMFETLEECQTILQDNTIVDFYVNYK